MKEIAKTMVRLRKGTYLKLKQHALTLEKKTAQWVTLDDAVVDLLKGNKAKMGEDLTK